MGFSFIGFNIRFFYRFYQRTLILENFIAETMNFYQTCFYNFYKLFYNFDSAHIL